MEYHDPGHDHRHNHHHQLIIILIVITETWMLRHQGNQHHLWDFRDIWTGGIRTARILTIWTFGLQRHLTIDTNVGTHNTCNWWSHFGQD